MTTWKSEKDMGGYLDGIRGNRAQGWEMDRTGSGLCAVMSFSDSATRELVNYN
jgi:hypothetical protein